MDERFRAYGEFQLGKAMSKDLPDGVEMNVLLLSMEGEQKSLDGLSAAATGTDGPPTRPAKALAEPGLNLR